MYCTKQMSVPLSSSFQCLKLAISVTRTKQKTLSGQDGLESIIDFTHLMQQIYEFIFTTERNLEGNLLFILYHPPSHTRCSFLLFNYACFFCVTWLS